MGGLRGEETVTREGPVSRHGRYILCSPMSFRGNSFVSKVLRAALGVRSH